MPLIMCGALAAIRRGEYDGKKFTSLQFTSQDRFGGIRLDVVYIDEGYDVSNLKVGQEVEIPVSASVNKKTGQLSFRMHDPAVEAQRPARPPLTVAK
jgi:hypothetical protein